MLIDFFFDFVSPYSFFANGELAAFSAKTGAAFMRRPVLLGAVFNATGNRAPMFVARKAEYMTQDLPRMAAVFGTTLRWPHHFPLRTVALLRAALAVRQVAPARYESFIEQAFFACWRDARDPSNQEVLASVAEAAGVDKALVIDANTTHKDALRAETERAIAAGCFGVPTFALDGELFFGVESLPFLEARIRRGAPFARLGAFPEISLEQK